MDCDALLQRALAEPKSIPVNDLAGMLSCNDAGFWHEVFAAARELKRRLGKDVVLPRGLIECSNICAKNCLYCGIRRDQTPLTRYRLTHEQVVACVNEARRRGYPAVAFQAGEIESEANTTFYESVMPKDLEVTLSLGEQTEAVYRRWRAAGALRYLIRIETSNPALYAKIHPAECSFARRVECIRTLKRLGYVTGSGVMIGLPGQTIRDLADDIAFFGRENLDMVGMGPYIPCAGTPLVACGQPITLSGATSFDLALRMIALVRLYLWDVNIVAATALEALDPQGREKGIAAGANVIMPNLTPPIAAQAYALYPGKVAVHLNVT